TKVIDILNEMPQVKEQISKLEKTKGGLSSVSQISYSGIVRMDNKELHRFILERADIRGSEIYMDFLATKYPFQIFEISNESDSLNLIHRDK
ncbi:MAG: hypothetical protein ACKO96_38865, partial [Flammeovirgaceae bacterium]